MLRQLLTSACDAVRPIQEATAVTTPPANSEADAEKQSLIRELEAMARRGAEKVEDTYEFQKWRAKVDVATARFMGRTSARELRLLAEIEEREG
jgi:hypothetical protein